MYMYINTHIILYIYIFYTYVYMYKISYIKFKLDFSRIREYLLRNFLICNKLLHHFYSTLAGSSILLHKNNFRHNTDSPFPSSESNSPLDRPQNKLAAARSSSVLLATTGQYISTGFFSHARAMATYSHTYSLRSFASLCNTKGY